MPRRKKAEKYVLCIKNESYPASLEVRKLYRVVPDAGASAHAMVRVVDESGEDYLYPQDWFIPIDLPEAAASAIAEGVA